MTRFQNSKVVAAAATVLAASSGVDGFFVAPSATPGVSNIHRPSASVVHGRGAVAPLKMSADDEVAKLRAAAQKAREQAAALAKEMGKDIETESATTVVAAKAGLSKDDALSLSSAVDFEAGDAVAQSGSLDALVESGDFALWKAAATGSAGTSSQAPLRPFPVSLNFLEQRSNGKITGESLGVDGEYDVSLDDIKDATIAVTLGSTIAAIAALAVLPENIGATVCYLIALIPVGFIAVGSTAPAVIAGAIASSKGTADDQAQREDRICRHEAGHFLCGYLCGLPVKEYSIDDSGFPCVEFHPSAEGEALGREFTNEEIAALSVVAMSGSVAEVLSFGQAKGGENDLLELNRLMRRSKEFIGAQKEQDLTRWGALAAFNLIQANMDRYEALVQAFKEKKSVADCVAAIETR